MRASSQRRVRCLISLAASRPPPGTRASKTPSRRASAAGSRRFWPSVASFGVVGFRDFDPELRVDADEEVQEVHRVEVDPAARRRIPALRLWTSTSGASPPRISSTLSLHLLSFITSSGSWSSRSNLGEVDAPRSHPSARWSPASETLITFRTSISPSTAQRRSITRPKPDRARPGAGRSARTRFRRRSRRGWLW